MRWCGALAVLLAAAPLAAQRPCFAARPLPACRVFFVTEVFLGTATNAHVTGAFNNVPIRENDQNIGVELGVMANLSATDALGAAFAFSNLGISFRPRYRRWVTPELALDVGPGVQWVESRIERFEANGSVMFLDRFGVFFGATRDIGEDRTEWNFGARLGREPAWVAYGIGLVIALMWMTVDDID